MGQFDLNLSTRPFPAYQLQTLLLTIGLIVLIGVSVWQAHGYIGYSAMVSQIRDDARSAQVDSEALIRRLSEIDSKLNRPEAAAKLTEIAYLNEIIARKRFSWTRLFASLENTITEGVHLNSLRPEFEDGEQVMVQMDVRGRTVDDITDFIEALQQSSVFDPVDVSFEEKVDNTKSSEVDVAIKVKYNPKSGE